MIIILDSCSLINLSNAKVLDKIFYLEGISFIIPFAVLDECKSIKGHLDQLINEEILLLDEETIDIKTYEEILNKYKLGDGETECISLCKITGHIMCSDDNRARKSGIKELGNENVIGSLRLLNYLSQERIISCSELSTAYYLMKSSGGFIPNLNPRTLC